MKRILAFIIVICIMLCASACSGSPSVQPQIPQTPQTIGGEAVNLAFNSADTFNPYTAKTTLNKNLCSLLFDPLVTVNSHMQSVNILAATCESNGNNLIITLKNANFTDGSPLTSDDVVYSFNLAKGSSSRYGAVLSTVTAAQARDANSVIFTLSKADPYAANLLTFPIIKIGTDQLKNEDNVYLTPVGTGRYTLNAEQNGLLSNKNWHGGTVNIETINLVNAPDKESLTHSVEIGAIDYYYTDLSDCNIIRMSGERINVNLNNLVFIGLNMNSGLFSSVYARHAVSAGIDRRIICEDGYYNNAIAATGVFNPVWNVISGSQTIENTANVKIAIENLEEIGYNKKDNEGYFLNSFGKPLSVSLLVNKENSFRLNAANLISKQLASVGIKVQVKAVDYENYTKLLASGDFDMYIAETNITYNMDISELVTPSGKLSFGIPEVAHNDKPDDEQDDTTKYALQNVINSFYSGTGNISDIAVTAISEMPIIPVCYRTGVLFSGDRISSNPNATADDIFFGFENITFNN